MLRSTSRAGMLIGGKGRREASGPMDRGRSAPPAVVTWRRPPLQRSVRRRGRETVENGQPSSRRSLLYSAARRSRATASSVFSAGNRVARLPQGLIQLAGDSLGVGRQLRLASRHLGLFGLETPVRRVQFESALPIRHEGRQGVHFLPDFGLKVGRRGVPGSVNPTTTAGGMAASRSAARKFSTCPFRSFHMLWSIPFKRVRR